MISDKELANLNSSDVELRRKALKNIILILRNNISFGSDSNEASTSEKSVVNLVLLVKNLIRYFGLVPVEDETEALELLHLIIKRRDFLDVISRTISIQRLRKEIRKIFMVVSKEKSHRIIKEINDILKLVLQGDNQDGNGSSSSSQLSSQDTDNLVNLMSQVQITENKETNPRTECEKNDNTNIAHCEILDERNLEIFETLHKTFAGNSSGGFLDYTLNFLSSAFDDYPIEFYFQPPYIFKDLINAFDQVADILAVKILKLFRRFANCLKHRLILFRIESGKEDTKFPFATSFVNSVMRLACGLIQHFPENGEDFGNENKFIELYFLLFEVIELVQETREFCRILTSELINDLAKIAKCCRIHLNQKFRLHYVISIYMLNKIVTLCQSEEVSKWGGSDLWKHESELALLDVPFKHFFISYYKKIRSTRIVEIRGDNELMCLLTRSKTLIPLIDLLKQQKSYDVEEFFALSEHAFETIELHKCQDLLKLLFVKIQEFSKQYPNDKDVNKNAERLFKKLITQQSTEMKRLIYKLSADSVNDKFRANFEKTENQEQCKEANLIVAVGIPLTTEIMGEIVICGINHKDGIIRDAAEKILSVILRGKCAFENFWPQIIEKIKLALPLFVTLSNHERLGIFALDIYCQDELFTDEELIEGYLRFLYCDNYRIRDLASQKLKSLLEKQDFNSYLVETLSPDMFILEDSEITEIVINSIIPNSKLQKKIEITMNLINEIDRSDFDVINTLLLQLNAMMNSVEACKIVIELQGFIHVYDFMSIALENQNRKEILQHCIEIFYKICIVDPNFRRLLASLSNEKNRILKAIMISDDKRVRKHGSIMFFLFSFINFVVGSDNNISMLNVLTKLKCPFKFNVHWVENPFCAEPYLIETIFKKLESNLEFKEKKEISWRFLRFIFGRSWFGSLDNLNNHGEFGLKNYLDVCEQKTRVLKFNQKLLMTDEDVKFLNLLNPQQILDRISRNIDNASTYQQVLEAIMDVKIFLILPMNVDNWSSILIKKLERFLQFDSNTNENCQVSVEITEWLCNLLNDGDEGVIEWSLKHFTKKNSKFMEILRDFKSSSYNKVLNILHATLKSFDCWSPEIKKILEDEEKKCKFDFLLKTFEILVQNLDAKITDGIEMNRLRITIATIRQIASIEKFTTDENFMRNTIKKCFKLAMYINQSNYKGSSAVRNLLTIALLLVNRINYFDFQSKTLTFLFSLCASPDCKIRMIVWSLFAQVAFKKENAEKFCLDFNALVPDGLFGLVFDRLYEKTETIQVKSGALAVLGCLITITEQDVNGNKSNEVKLMDICKSTNFAMTLLESLIMDDVINTNIKCYCYVIKKFIEWNALTLSDKLKMKTIQTTFKFISDAKLFESHKAIGMVTEACELITYCWNVDQLQPIIHARITAMSNESLNDFFIVARMAMLDRNADIIAAKHQMYRSLLNVMKIIISFEEGANRIKSYLGEAENCEVLIRILGIGLRTKNSYDEITFYLDFIIFVIKSAKKYEDSMLFAFEQHPITFDIVRDVLTCKLNASRPMNILPHNTNMDEKWSMMEFLFDLIIFEVIDICEFVEFSELSPNLCYDMKAQCHHILELLSLTSNRVEAVLRNMDVISLIYKKVNLFYLRSSRDANEKIILEPERFKELGLLVRALTVWKLDFQDPRIKEISILSLKMFGFAHTDKNMMKSFLMLLNRSSKFNFGKEILLAEIEGLPKPIQLMLIDYINKITMKYPHSEDNISLLKIGLNILKNSCQFLEIRLSLANLNVFKIFEQLHPQLKKTTSTWDRITYFWLQLFKEYSGYEDVDCKNGHVSNLCRLVRIGNASIRDMSLKTIRNFSMSGTIGKTLMSIRDFEDTVGVILCKPNFFEEKYLCVMTLLSICSKCDRMKAKVKNSSLDRKLKQLSSSLKGESDTHNLLLSCLTMLNQVLYPTSD